MVDGGIDSRQFIELAKAKGFSIFYGTPEVGIPHVDWDETAANFDAFLEVAKKEGASVLFIDRYIIDQSDIEAVGDNQDLKKVLKLHMGQCAAFLVSWVKGNMEYRYSECTDWWAECLEQIGKDEERKHLGIDR